MLYFKCGEAVLPTLRMPLLLEESPRPEGLLQKAVLVILLPELMWEGEEHRQSALPVFLRLDGFLFILPCRSVLRYFSGEP